MKSEDVEIGGNTFKKVRMSMLGKVKSVYLFAHNNYFFTVNYDYGQNDQDKEAVKNIFGSLNLQNFTSGVDKSSHHFFDHDLHGIHLNTENSDWLIREFDNLAQPVRLELDGSPEVTAKVSVKKKKANLEGLSNNEIYNMNINDLETALEGLSRIGGYSKEILNAKSYAKINDNINDAIMTEIRISEGDKNILIGISYEIYGVDKIYTIELKYSGESKDMWIRKINR